MEILLSTPATGPQILEVFCFALQTANLRLPWKVMTLSELRDSNTNCNKCAAVAYLEDECKDGNCVTSSRIVLLPVINNEKVSMRTASVGFGTRNPRNVKVTDPLFGAVHSPGKGLSHWKYARDFNNFVREFKGLTATVVGC